MYLFRESFLDLGPASALFRRERVKNMEFAGLDDCFVHHWEKQNSQVTQKGWQFLFSHQMWVTAVVINFPLS